MKKRRVYINYVFLLLIIFPLGGCWDKAEIEKKAYVIAMGLDKGKDSNIKITYLIANPDYGTQVQGGGTDEPPQEIITFETGDIITAETKANMVVAKEISYDLLRNILVSEKLAKDKNFIRWIYDTTKQREIRRDVFFIVTKEDVSKFFENNKPKLESRAHKYFDLIIRRGIDTGLIPKAELHRYLRITESDADLFLAIYATTEHRDDEDIKAMTGDQILAGQFHATGETNKTQFLGSAVFKNGTMIGKLTGEETRITNILSEINPTPEMVISIPDPFNKEFRLAAKIKKLQKNKFDFKLQGNHSAKINVTVPLSVDILTDQSMVNYAKNIHKQKILKKYLEDRLTEKMSKFVKMTQEEYGSEPLAWSLLARKKFPTIPQYQAFDWEHTYKNMDVHIKVEITFGSFGRQSKTPSLKNVRD